MRKHLMLAFCACCISMISSSQNIFDACRKGDTTALKSMIAENPDTVNCRNEGGFTPLIIAGYRNQIGVVKLLLENNADVNAKSGEGTVLIGACFKGNIALVKLLLTHGADVNATNELGSTSLMYSIMGQNIELIKILIENGANKEMKDGSGKSCHDYAVQTGNKEIIALFK
jgi:ankyrin repeat protein